MSVVCKKFLSTAYVLYAAIKIYLNDPYKI